MQQAGVKRALAAVAAVVLIAAIMFAIVLSSEGGEAEAAALKRGSTCDRPFLGRRRGGGCGAEAREHGRQGERDAAQAEKLGLL